MSKENPIIIIDDDDDDDGVEFCYTRSTPSAKRKKFIDEVPAAKKKRLSDQEVAKRLQKEECLHHYNERGIPKSSEDGDFKYSYPGWESGGKKNSGKWIIYINQSLGEEKIIRIWKELGSSFYQGLFNHAMKFRRSERDLIFMIYVWDLTNQAEVTKVAHNIYKILKNCECEKSFNFKSDVYSLRNLYGFKTPQCKVPVPTAVWTCNRKGEVSRAEPSLSKTDDPRLHFWSEHGGEHSVHNFPGTEPSRPIKTRWRPPKS
mmetsp:Transcript_4805/g.6804  ORF Transcript_4805/g.6804 Transcript_4805/m.6804 type:complete len:260 (+) Transcript_4805:68-847(+)